MLWTWFHRAPIIVATYEVDWDRKSLNPEYRAWHIDEEAKARGTPRQRSTY